MSWKQQLIDVVFFSGLGSVLAKALPDHWQRRANERLNDFNPFEILSRMAQTAQAHPDASEAESLARLG
ncbi:MAG: hypothetical protein KDE66_10765 [Nitrosomonas sp.]|nr:hypothetical protein [Nitrosomonas sp.]